MKKNQPTSYGAFLVLTASFSLKMGITLKSNNEFTVSESCFLKPESLKNPSFTRSWEEVTSSCTTKNLVSASIWRKQQNRLQIKEKKTLIMDCDDNE